jgi:hypothetical protein
MTSALSRLRELPETFTFARIPRPRTAAIGLSTPAPLLPRLRVAPAAAPACRLSSPRNCAIAPVEIAPSLARWWPDLVSSPHMGLERQPHGPQVIGSRAAASADDARAGIQGQAGVLSHQLRGAVEANGSVDELGNSAVRLGHENRRGLRRRGEVDDAGHQFRRPRAAITAASRKVIPAMQFRELRGRDAHHRSTIGIEAQGGHHRQTGGARAATAASVSSTEDMVSIQSRSAPPLASAAACSAKASRAPSRSKAPAAPEFRRSGPCSRQPALCARRGPLRRVQAGPPPR